MRSAAFTLAGLFGGGFCLLLLAGAGCMTRSGAPVYGSDSTLVYPSRLANDVNASITFQLKDSALRDAAKKRDKDRSRESSRLRRERAAILSEIKDETARRQKAEAKRQAQEERKARKAKGKRSKKGKSPGDQASPAPVPVEISKPNPALRDSLSAIEARLSALAAEDSVASLAPWKIKREDGRPPDDRVVDLEDGARVQATVHLENVYARGKRPLLFHFVWLNPEKKRVFKKMLEYMPNDSTQSLTSSFTISPAKRSSGLYTIQVFLFREEVAEKAIALRGIGVEEKEGGEGGGM
jgi:hypothetical protein